MVLPVLPYYTAAKALQTDEGKRIAGGIVEQSIIRGPVELFRTMKDMVGEDIDRQLEPAYGPRLKKKDSTAARIQQEAKTEETIKESFYLLQVKKILVRRKWAIMQMVHLKWLLQSNDQRL